MSFFTNAPIDSAALVRDVLRRTDGATVLFEGVVRNHNEGKQVDSIDYEAYLPMAEKEMAAVIDAVRAAYPDAAMTVVHRLGHLAVGDTSIAIACASPHRAEAFAACKEVIDRIKKTVPIWKKEHGPNGEEWVGWQCTHE